MAKSAVGPSARTAASIALTATLLLWPAIRNGYPIVFADSGTYLSQAVHAYLGWDRPIFYSLAILPLHVTWSLWPVAVAQALLAAWVLHLTGRCLTQHWSGSRLVALGACLAIGSWLPWLACQIMPDVLTPLLVLALCLLVLTSDRLDGAERLGLLLLATLMIAAQQSSLPLTALMLATLLPLRKLICASQNPLLPAPRRSPRPMSPPRTLNIALLPPVLAILALLAVNLVGHHRLSLSPFGNVFILSRIIYDGPGMGVLRRDCPAAGWRLCPFLDLMPPTSDEFLWRADSPIILAGGHKAVSTDADAIIAAALRAEPWTALRAVAANGWTQLLSFASGDGLEAWPAEVDPWIERDFPPVARAAYYAARQQQGVLQMPAWLPGTHRLMSIAGIGCCILLLPMALRRRHVAAGFLAAALVALPASALITGGLSTPHDRYQARVMWLPLCVALLAAPALRGRTM